jgi:Leucine-rich repeat (LRR) protein
LENLPLEFKKLQKLVELGLCSCSKLGCLHDWTVDLLEFKIIQMYKCHKLENLVMELRKLQTLVELDLSNCFKLGCLPNSIMDLSQLKTFWLSKCHKLDNLPMEFGKFQNFVGLIWLFPVGVFTLFNCGLVTT